LNLLSCEFQSIDQARVLGDEKGAVRQAENRKSPGPSGGQGCGGQSVGGKSHRKEETGEQGADAERKSHGRHYSVLRVFAKET